MTANVPSVNRAEALGAALIGLGLVHPGESVFLACVREEVADDGKGGGGVGACDAAVVSSVPGPGRPGPDLVPRVDMVAAIVRVSYALAAEVAAAEGLDVAGLLAVNAILATWPTVEGEQ